MSDMTQVRLLDLLIPAGFLLGLFGVAYGLWVMAVGRVRVTRADTLRGWDARLVGLTFVIFSVSYLRFVNGCFQEYRTLLRAVEAAGGRSDRAY